jgi:hypothetical protein
MGTSPSSDATSVKEISDSDLKNKKVTDEEYATILSQLWDPTYVAKMKGISKDGVPQIRSVQTKPGDIKTAEIAAAILQSSTDKRQERLTALKTEIQKQIRFELSQEADSTQATIERRMKAAVTVH